VAGGELGRENLTRALDGLAAAIALDTTRFPEFVCDVIDSGRIQKFEYSVELFWKHLRGCLLEEGLDVPNSPRAAIKAALERGFVTEAEYQPALDLIADRNTCSHVSHPCPEAVKGSPRLPRPGIRVLPRSHRGHGESAAATRRRHLMDSCRFPSLPSDVFCRPWFGQESPSTSLDGGQLVGYLIPHFLDHRHFGWRKSCLPLHANEFRFHVRNSFRWALSRVRSYALFWLAGYGWR